MAIGTEGPPANGGTSREYLQRIEQAASNAVETAVRAAKKADETNQAVLDLRAALLGSPLIVSDNGAVGRLNQKLDDFILATKQQERMWASGRSASRAMRISVASLGVLLISAIGGLIVNFVK